MRQRIAAMLALLLTFTALSARAADMPVDKMDQSTVRIIARKSGGIASGSGFVIGNGRYVVTNHHVIEDADEVYVWAKLLQSRVIRIVADSPEKDLAILEMAESTGLPDVTLGLKAGVHKTQTVFTAGFPGAADEGNVKDNYIEVKYTQGIISGFIVGEHGEALYEISAAVNPGNSGGPLFDECGRVIGINVAKSLVTAYVQGPDGQPTTQRVPLGEGIAWSIQADELLSLMQSKNIPIRSESTPCTPGNRSDTVPTTGSSSGTAGSLLPTPVHTTPPPPSPVNDLRLPIIVAAVVFLFIVVIIIVLMVRPRRKPAPQPVHHVTPPVPPILPRPQPHPAYEPQPELRLRGVSGTHAGMEFPLSETRLTLGRDPAQSQIVFNKSDVVVGRRHCTVRLDRSSGGVVLEDCGSTNGTFLENGERLKSGESRTLRSNARFYLGNRDYMFQVK